MSAREPGHRAARALLTDHSITVAEVAERLNVSVATLYRHLPGIKLKPM